MATASGPEELVQDREAVREEWLGRLGALIDDVKRWAEGDDWSTRLITKKMEDSQVGDYRAPALLLQKETARVLLDPIGQSAPGAEGGVVDLYLMPAYDGIATIYFTEGAWRLEYTFDRPPAVATAEEGKSVPVDREAIARVLDAMVRHAA